MLTAALLRITIVFLLVAVNAFFVAAEFALVNVRQTRLEQMLAQGRIGARTVSKLLGKFELVLSGVQLGVTMASLALGWLGEEGLAGVLEVPLRTLPHGWLYAHALATAVAFCVITYLVVILGEVVPKSVTLRRAERVALAVAAPLDLFITVFSPVLKLLAASSSMVLRAFGMKPSRASGVHSPEEIKLVATASRRLGLLPLWQEALVHRSLDLGTVTVREVMVPRPDIFSLPDTMTAGEAIHRVVETHHSRVPVYDEARGTEAIIGVLYARDLMRWMQYPSPPLVRGESARRQPMLRVREIMREVLVVPETLALPDLLNDFKERKTHIAVVVDEFGSTAGLVTVENVLEQLVGEIVDEFAPAKTATESDGVLTLDGSASIRDLELQFGISLPRDEGYETLAGFVLTQLQHLPEIGESFDYEGRRYTVRQLDGRRVASVSIVEAGKAEA
jgi:CBS domain containing-hemolysin-like protein